MAMYTFGDRIFAADLGRAAGTVGAKAAAATLKAGADITSDAKALAPVDTGNLRSSTGMTVTGSGAHGRMSVEVGPTAHYGIYVEYGTSRMAAQPYLNPATDRHVDAWYAALGQVTTL